MSIVRRAGATIAKIIAGATDPATVANTLQLYAKSVSGVVQLFARASDGTVEQLTGLAAAAAAVIFDDSVAGTDVNIRSSRATNQSPIDNTKAQITNFGSQDGTLNAKATGATGIASTIGGGDDNTASGNYSTVGGGGNNTASGVDSTVVGGLGATASGQASVAGGAATASGPNSTAFGSGTAGGDHSVSLGGGGAGGAYSFAAGQGTAEVDFSVAFSTGSATGLHAFAEGNNTQSEGASSHAEGDGTIASAAQAHAEGLNTLAQGIASHAEGNGTNASGNGSHAEGVNTLANGLNSHVEGDSSTTSAAAYAAHARGEQSQAIREGQTAVACGQFAAAGDAQASLLVLRGSTPGSVSGESVELKFGKLADQTLQLEDNKGYLVTVSAVAKGSVSASPAIQSFVQKFAVRRASGTTTIAAAGASEQIGDDTAASWTLAATVGATPDRFMLTFTTGSTTSAVRVVAKVEFVEVSN